MVDYADLDDLKIVSKMMTRHCLGIAATGGGKSNFLNLILKQQMMRGGGVVHIDGKNSKEAIIEFLSLAKQHNRWQDVRIINIDSPEYSNTYNPLIRGDGDELTSRVMQLLPDQGGSGAFFRSQAGRGMRAIAGILKSINKPYNFGDLNVLMSNESAMKHLLRMAPPTKEAKDFKIFMDQMMTTDPRSGEKVLNTQKLQHTFGDLAGRLHSYYVGKAGRVLNSYSPEVDLYDAVRNNLLVYVALPMLSKNEIAVDFAKFFVSDLRTAIGQIQNDDYKPSPTFLCLMDEFSSYAMPSLAPVFEQARSSNICMFPFIQTYSSLTDKGRGLGEDFAAKILGNTWNKISFLLQEPESCAVMSSVAGEALTENVSESISENLSFQAGDDDSSVLRTGARGRGHSKSISMQYSSIVRPEDFRNLADGEGIYIGRKEVLKLQVPLVHLNVEDKEIEMPRFRMPARQGLGIAELYDSLGGKG